MFLGFLGIWFGLGGLQLADLGVDRQWLTDAVYTTRALKRLSGRFDAETVLTNGRQRRRARHEPTPLDEQSGPTSRPATRCSRHRAESALGDASGVAVDAPSITPTRSTQGAQRAPSPRAPSRARAQAPRHRGAARRAPRDSRTSRPRSDSASHASFADGSS